MSCLVCNAQSESADISVVDTLVVIGHEKLSIDLTRQFPSVRTIRFPKSGGTVDLDDAYRQVVQAAQVRAYFYGEPSLPKELSNLPGKMVAREGILSPYSFQIGWETLTILRVGEGEQSSPLFMNCSLMLFSRAQKTQRLVPLYLWARAVYSRQRD